MSRHAVGGSLLRQISASHRAAHQILQSQQGHKHSRIHTGQPGINGVAQNNGIEYQAKEEFQVGLQLVNQLKKYMKRFIG